MKLTKITFLIFIITTATIFSQNFPVTPKGFVNGNLKTKVLFHPDSTIILEWVGNINNANFKIKLGSQTGTYDFENDFFPMPVEGEDVGSNIFRQSFSGEETVLPIGRYYGIITNSQYSTLSEIVNDENALYSNEFQIIITARNAPVATSPLGTIDNPTPTFTWNAIPGVVSYWLLLSSNPFEITTDSLGNISIEGANLIWNYTTNQTSAVYGDVNPLNPYDMGTPPPLLSGHTYNYVILNLYEENNPIFGSPVTSGIFSFTYQAEEEQEPPQLLTPEDSAYFDATSEIVFSWESVNWANLYTIYLYQRLTSFGGNDQTIDVPVWNASTTNTEITFDAGNSLTKGTYVWYVVPSDAQGSGTASETYSFYYNKELGVFRLKAVSTVDNTPLLNYQAQAVALVGGITPANPFLVIDAETYTDSLVTGLYQFTGSKVGFIDTTVTVEISSENGINNPVVITFPLTPLPGIINGKVLEEGTNLPLSNVNVTLTNTVTNNSLVTVTNSNGNFSFSTEYGSYYLSASKEGYLSGNNLFFNLNEQQLTLETIYLTKDEANISGKIINDLGEPIQLANVIATNGSNSFQTNSSGEGDYNFTLTSGTWQISASKTGFISPEPITVTLATGDNLQNQNLSLQPRAAQVTGKVFKVIQGNLTTIPFSGVNVTAEPLSGTAQTVVTDNDGSFSFSLRYGTYVFYAEKTGYTSSESIQLTLELGETINNIDFTLTPNPSTISGRVKLPDGTSLTNATVTSDNSISTITDANGNYTLSVTEGTHSLSASKDGYIPSEPMNISILPGENFTGIDFILTPNAGTISGRVLHNGEPLFNASVVAFNGLSQVTKNTDANGNYSISLAPGSWEIIAQKNGYIPSDTLTITIAPGQTSGNNNFSLIQNIATLSGITTSNSIPLGNVDISLLNLITNEIVLTTVSNANGQFSAVVGAGNQYKIVASKSGYASAEITTGELFPESQLQVNLELQPNPSSVSGTIYSNNSGTIPGANIVFAADDGTVIKSVSSASDGSYYAGISAGTYNVSVSKQGYVSSQTNITVSVGQNLSNVNFTLSENFASVSGFVKDGFGNGIPGVMVNATSDFGGRTAFTSGDGSYLLNRLIGGTYSIHFSKENYSDTTVANFEINDGENKTVNVRVSLLNGEINGYVTLTDGTPVENATVKLVSETVGNIYSVSDENGFFLFSSLSEGSYSVSASKSGYRSSLNIPVTISAQDSVVTVNINDFELNVAEIFGTVYDSADNLTIGGVVVSVAGENGTVSATTDNSGAYLLPNIPPGIYELTATLSNYTVSPITINISDTTEAIEQNIFMNKITGSITGLITDDNGLSLGFPITVNANSNQNSYSTQTDDNGLFVFNEVQPDSDYVVSTEIYREGYENISVENVIVLENQTTNLGELHPKISLSKVYGNAGTPNVYLTLVSDDGNSFVQRSNALGDFSFDYLSAGDYSLTPQKEGFAFEPQIASFNLAIYEEKNIDFTANSQIGTIKVVVTDNENNSLSSVNVAVVSSDTSIVRASITNTEGIAFFNELPVNSYIVTPTLEGYSSTPENENVVVNSGDTTSVIFTLIQNSASFSGIINKRLENGDVIPLSDASVDAKRIATGETFRTTSDGNGNYSLSNLSPDIYDVTVFKTGFTGDSTRADLRNGNIDNLNFILEPEIVILKGSVVSRNSGDINSLEIKAVSALGEFFAVTNESGEFTFDELPIFIGENDTTVYNISINDNRFSFISKQIRISSSRLNSIVEVSPFILPSGEISVSIKECDNYLSNVSVTIIKPDGNSITKLTDNSGTISSGTNLFAGEYSIGVTINGFLLPDEFSVSLPSDTSTAQLEIQLPYKANEIEEILSNAPTYVEISFPNNCENAANGLAKIYYKKETAPLYESVNLSSADSSFTGEIPPLFTESKIQYYYQVINDSIKYKSDVFEIKPKAVGILTQIQFNPSLDNVVIRKGDNYKISLILRDGLNNSLTDKFTGENHPGKITWLIPDGFSVTFPNENDSVSVIINANDISGNRNISVTASLDGITLSKTSVLNVNDLGITSFSVSAPQTRISNRSAGMQFNLTAKDSSGRTVALGSGVTWSISPLNAISEEDYRYFTETGYYKPIDSTFVGIVTVEAEDEVSGLKDKAEISVYAEIYPSSSLILSDGSGFNLAIPQQSVTVPIELNLRKSFIRSVKKYVKPINSEKTFIADNSSYVITYNSSSALPGDSLQKNGTLILPVSDEFKFIDKDKIISFYEPTQKGWILLNNTGKNNIEGNVTEYDRFTRFGEYSILAESEPLGIKYAAVLPNPFSPNIAPVKIGYYLTTDAPPAFVTIKIYNINGMLVKTLLENDVQFPGRYGSSSSLKQILWDGKTDDGYVARNGRYVIRITAKDGKNQISKILQVILIK